MWVDFKVIDANKRVIYRLGRIKNGKTEPQAKTFKIVMADAKGNVVEDDVTKVARVLYDTRILPKSFSDLEYTFEIPKDAVAPLSVSADLNYWSFSQHLADELLGKGKLQVPIERIATVELGAEGRSAVRTRKTRSEPRRE